MKGASVSYSEFWRMSATEQTNALNKGDISSAEAVSSSIDRMRAVNGDLNAVVMNLSEQALERASQLDNQRQKGDPCGPLHGLPITVKVNVDQAGWATTNGIQAMKDLIAQDDAPVVKNLLDAGAVVIGRTNTPEFSFRAETDNPIHGRTNNPWGRHISPGGSSGGAGAAVMAGIGALAHGNDIGGSLRFPAAANGAFTVKPGLGRVPAWNPTQKAERGMLAQSMSVQGVITRSALDLELAMPTLVRSDPRDPFHVPLPYRMSVKSNNLKVAYWCETPGFDTHPAVYKALTAAAEALRDAGYEVEEKEPPLLEETARAGYGALLGEVAELMGPDIRKFGSETIQNIFAEYFRQFRPAKDLNLLKAMAKRSHYARQWSLFLYDYPLYLTPFLPQPYFQPDRDREGEEGVREVLGSALWSYSMNFVGLPAGNLPTYLAQMERGPQPINVQIIGQRWREDAVVDAMIEIEKRLGTMCDALWERMA